MRRSGNVPPKNQQDNEQPPQIQLQVDTEGCKFHERQRKSLFLLCVWRR
nr:MAG TPA: hypothetical protein [Caudoviricetes sp.]